MSYLFVFRENGHQWKYLFFFLINQRTVSLNGTLSLPSHVSFLRLIQFRLVVWSLTFTCYGSWGLHVVSEFTQIRNICRRKVGNVFGSYHHCFFSPLLPFRTLKKRSWAGWMNFDAGEGAGCWHVPGAHVRNKNLTTQILSYFSIGEIQMDFTERKWMW